jgi:GntR family transcriptional regulator/MocR family aminotransferase
MKQLTLNITHSKAPYYLRLSQALIESIRSAQITSGERLPSARALAEQLQVNRHTIMRSYQELVAQGWVENSERRYYKVSQNLPIQGSFHEKGTENKSQAAFQWVIHKDLQDSNFIKSTAEFEFNFAGGKPDTSLFPFNEYRSHVNDALKKPSLKSLNYGENSGHPALLDQAEIYLRRTRSIQDKTLMITNGSQEALYLIANLLLKAGDNIAVESLGYPPAWQAFKGAGASLVAIKQDSYGLCAEHLELMASTRSLKGIYLTPLHQYPTTVTLDASRRLAIYKIAVKYQLFIIEDDYDHEYHYKCQPISPMASNDPAQLIIYLSSFSKIMFPAARIGMLAAPAKLTQALVNFRTTINHKPALLQQDALARWMASNGFERHIRRSTKAYQQRLDNALLQLELANAKGANLKYKIPDGGMALWIQLPIDSELLAEHLKQQSIYLQHQKEFMLDRHCTDIKHHIRLGFAGQSIETFNLGFSKIINLALQLLLSDSA